MIENGKKMARIPPKFDNSQKALFWLQFCDFERNLILRRDSLAESALTMVGTTCARPWYQLKKLINFLNVISRRFSLKEAFTIKNSRHFSCEKSNFPPSCLIMNLLVLPVGTNTTPLDNPVLFSTLF